MPITVFDQAKILPVKTQILEDIILSDDQLLFAALKTRYRYREPYEIFINLTSPSLTILVPFWFDLTSLVFAHPNKWLFPFHVTETTQNVVPWLLISIKTHWTFKFVMLIINVA